MSALIDEYLMERNRTDRRLRHYAIDMSERPRPPGRFSPSNMAGCRRQAAFKFTSMPGRTVVDPDREFIFDDGNWRHHRWQATMEDMEQVLGKDRIKVLSKEAGIEVPELFIAGHSDNLLRIKFLDGKRRKVVVDYKGINDNGYAWVAREDEPHHAHVIQLHAYMVGHGVSRALLIYDNKNNQRTKIFYIEFDPNLWQELIDWCQDVVADLNAEKVPPMAPECEAGTFLYEKCPWSHWCYGSATLVRIQRTMYRDFLGVEETWQEGKRAEEEHDSI